ncbi:mRNA interferase MazF [Ruminococcaceae bacterium FB2012]|nr:mRNA interferase MazF [Ruminococcaceae bacterium FB2012]
MEIQRGDVFYIDEKDIEIEPVVGSEQKGHRPVIVIQNNIGNKYSPTTVVAYITTQRKNPLPTHVGLHNTVLKSTSIAMLEQIRTVSKYRLKRYIGTLTNAEMKKIDRALMISLSLNGKEKN